MQFWILFKYLKIDLVGVCVAAFEYPLDDLSCSSCNCLGQDIVVIINLGSKLLPINIIFPSWRRRPRKARMLSQKRVQQAQTATIRFWECHSITQWLIIFHRQRKQIVKDIKLHYRLIFCQRPLKVVTNFNDSRKRNILVENPDKRELPLGELYSFSFVHEMNCASWNSQQNFLFQCSGFWV